jgi:hypothetical protein
MPKSCAECLLKQYDDYADDYFCAGLKEVVWIGKNVYDGGKHVKCPLKLVGGKSECTF